MVWLKLVTDKRFKTAESEKNSAVDRALPDMFSNLQRDVSLIVGTSAFRRLQGKAQLFISPESDFVRNRLTHTLEAVTIARSLASLILGDLNKNDSGFVACQRNGTNGHLRKRDMVESIAAACYMHDIGNPPFGHVSEDAISDWFSRKNSTLTL
jgi:dGTPase